MTNYVVTLVMDNEGWDGTTAVISAPNPLAAIVNLNTVWDSEPVPGEMYSVMIQLHNEHETCVAQGYVVEEDGEIVEWSEADE